MKGISAKLMYIKYFLFCVRLHRRISDNYLARANRSGRTGRRGADRGAFLDGVIRHAYQQGIANLLIGQDIALKIYVRGWSDIDSLSQYAAGPIDFAKTTPPHDRVGHCSTFGPHPTPMRSNRLVNPFFAAIIVNRSSAMPGLRLTEN